MSIIDSEDEERAKEEEVIKRRKALRIVAGGKDPPDEEAEPWLSSLKRFTVFLAYSPKLNLDLLEYHVLTRTKKSVKLGINMDQIIRWVDPEDFCSKFILHEVIYVPVDEE